MPGKWWEPGGVKRVAGSLMPPRHWRTKAMAAKDTGRSVRRRRIFEVKDWEEEEEEGVERRDAWSWWWLAMAVRWCTYSRIQRGNRATTSSLQLRNEAKKPKWHCLSETALLSSRTLTGEIRRMIGDFLGWNIRKRYNFTSCLSFFFLKKKKYNYFFIFRKLNTFTKLSILLISWNL